MYNKNDKIELDIVDMTIDGLGIAKKESQVFFVKNAIIGDKVEAIITKVNDDKKNDNKKNNIIFAKVIRIIKKSNDRIIPQCEVSNKCGGCQIMALAYDKQIELKKRIVENNLIRIGGFGKDIIDEKFEGIIGMDEPYYFRNKVQVPFALKDGKVITGFYAGRTHYIIENKICITGFKESSKIINDIKYYLNNYLNDDKKGISIYDEKTGDGIFREVLLRKGNNSDEISLTFIVNDKKISEHNDVEKYVLLSQNIINKNKNIVTVH